MESRGDVVRPYSKPYLDYFSTLERVIPKPQTQGHCIMSVKSLGLLREDQV